MPANEITVPLNLEAAKQQVEALKANLKQLTAEAQAFVSTMNSAGGGGAGGSAHVRAVIGAVGSAQSAINSVQSSISSPMPSAVTPAASAAASAIQGSPGDIASYNSFINKYPGLGKAAYAQVADQLGLSFGPAAGAVTAAHITQAANLTRTLALPTMAMPAGGGGMYAPSNAAAGWPTMQMPAWAAPFQMGGGAGGPAGGGGMGGGPTAPGGSPSWGFSGGNWNPRNRMAAWGTAGYGAANYAAGGMSLYASNTASGEIDPMAAAALHGGMGMGAIGALLGALYLPAPGIGAGIGYLSGQQQGAALAQASIAPFMSTRNSASSLASVSSRLGVGSYDLLNPGSGVYGMFGSKTTGPAGPGLSQLAETISGEGKSARDKMLISSGLYTGLDIISGPQISRTYSTVASALMSSGESPDLALNPTAALARKFGINAERMASMGAPVIAARNRMGRNPTDLFLQFGQEAYGAASDSGMGLPGMGLPSMDSSGPAFKAFQLAGFAAQTSSYLARGAGANMERAFRQQEAALRSMPGGTDSLAFMETRASARAASMMQYGDDIGVRYGIPQIGMREELARARVAPYAPGRYAAASAQLIRSEFREASDIDSFVARRRKSGDLSVDEELSLRGRSAAARIAGYQGIAEFSEGGANLLPGIAGAGRWGTSFRRFTGMQQAAFFLDQYGSPRVGEGAINGGHRARQQAFFDGLGVPSGPSSRSEGVNNSFSGARLEGLLQQILHELQKQSSRGAGSFSKPNRGPGDLDRVTGPRGWDGP